MHRNLRCTCSSRSFCDTNMCVIVEIYSSSWTLIVLASSRFLLKNVPGFRRRLSILENVSLLGSCNWDIFTCILQHFVCRFLHRDIKLTPIYWASCFLQSINKFSHRLSKLTSLSRHTFIFGKFWLKQQESCF